MLNSLISLNNFSFVQRISISCNFINEETEPIIQCLAQIYKSFPVQILPNTVCRPLQHADSPMSFLKLAYIKNTS